MGAANIVVLTALYLLGPKEAFAISMVRIVLSGFAFGIGTLPYSLAGGLLSLGLMLLMKKSGRFGMPGVSVAGGVMHNVGQILMAMLLLETAELGYYLVVLTVTGIIAGVFVGLCGSLLVKHVPNKLRF